MKTPNIFSKTMAAKSTEDLETILENKEKYQAAAIQAVLWELEERGHSSSIEVDLHEPKKEEASEPFFERAPENYTDDLNAPELYPKWSIWITAFFTNTMFAGILLSMNLYRVGKKKIIIFVMAFSVLYYLLIVSILDYMESIESSSYYYVNLLNIIGAIILDTIFWNHFIGKNTKFRKRSPLIPLLIFGSIAVLSTWLLISEF